jgi:hypothetical protein
MVGFRYDYHYTNFGEGNTFPYQGSFSKKNHTNLGMYKNNQSVTLRINLFNTSLLNKILYVIAVARSRVSVVGIATSYGLDDRGLGVRVPMGSIIFFPPDRPDRL